MEQALDAKAKVSAATTPVTSLGMSLAALRIDPSAEVRQTLVNTLLHTSYQGSGQPLTPGGSAQTAAFSPNDRLLADVSNESTDTVVSLWTITDPTHPTLLNQPAERHAVDLPSPGGEPHLPARPDHRHRVQLG